jgi:3-isopropylmalate/(R)-2-methylmalate dehydratase large subunit
MHAVQKILAAASGRREVTAGEIVTARIDLAGINDIYPAVIDVFTDMGGTAVWDPEKVAIFMDHNTPSSTVLGAENQRAFRQFAKAQNIRRVFEVECGVCHEVAVQAGLVRPGDVILITDSHATTHGALGAFSTGVGFTDLAVALLEGALWFRVPETTLIRLEGGLRDGVAAKDVTLHILGTLGTDFGNYRALEFAGPVVDRLPVEERMVLTNMAVEMGAKCGYVQPDERTLAYVTARTRAPFTVRTTDPDYRYDREHVFTVDDLEPQVACPGRVDDARAVREAAGIPIDQVFIGSCTGGRLTDIAAAARMLDGKRVAKGTRLIVSMASKEILEASIAAGYLQILVAAGAAITTPGCGPCFGLHAGVLAAGERCVTTSSRNYPGRMGSQQAEIYLASARTAAATAITGRLTDPRDPAVRG